MPQLIAPTVRVQASFLEALEEFRGEGRGGPADASMIGRDIERLVDTWHDPQVFAGYVDGLRADAREETPRAEGMVACTTLWYVDGDTFLGRLAIRHRLTPWLLEYGGHIGYDVRASARRRGHATAMLRAGLPIARALGIDPALITCDTDNVASRRVIEANGGVLEDRRGCKLRYWVATGPRTGEPPAPAQGRTTEGGGTQGTPDRVPWVQQ
jgi:predicted acetyltransferase